MGVRREGGSLLHGKAFSLGRAEGSLHGEACSLRRTENPLHVCTSLGCQSLYIYWTHGPQIVHFDNLGSLAQKWLKMAPKSSIFTTWAAWPRNVQNGFQIVLSRLRPISPYRRRAFSGALDVQRKPLDVQRALCTSRRAGLTVRNALCTSRRAVLTVQKALCTFRGPGLFWLKFWPRSP